MANSLVYGEIADRELPRYASCARTVLQLKIVGYFYIGIYIKQVTKVACYLSKIIDGQTEQLFRFLKMPSNLFWFVDYFVEIDNPLILRKVSTFFKYKFTLIGKFVNVFHVLLGFTRSRPFTS